jgi:hypothetical protein
MHMLRVSHRSVFAFAMMAVIVAAIGCEKPAETAAPNAKNTTTAEPAKTAAPIIPVNQIVDWCPEHGVPESVCTRCNESLIAGFKAKGDWDDQHNLPKSQCFVCDPSLKEKFAAAFKEKYGKDAPSGGADDKP